MHLKTCLMHFSLRASEKGSTPLFTFPHCEVCPVTPQALIVVRSTSFAAICGNHPHSSLTSLCKWPQGTLVLLEALSHLVFSVDQCTPPVCLHQSPLP